MVDLHVALTSLGSCDGNANIFMIHIIMIVLDRLQVDYDTWPVMPCQTSLKYNARPLAVSSELRQQWTIRASSAGSKMNSWRSSSADPTAVFRRSMEDACPGCCLLFEKAHDGKDRSGSPKKTLDKRWRLEIVAAE